MSPGTASSGDFPTSPSSPEVGDKAPLLKVPHLLIRGQSDQAGTEEEASLLMTSFHDVARHYAGCLGRNGINCFTQV